MRNSHCLLASGLPLLAAMLAGCAEQGSFPSLLPRPIEQAGAEPDPPTPAPTRPADPALAARITEIVAQARQGQEAFERQLAETRVAVTRAGAAQSESWVEAQQALSRLEAARAPTVSALGDLDLLAIRHTQSPDASEPDRAAIAAAIDQVAALADGQREEISRLSDLLPPA